jgi:hypothetical protein
VRKLAFVVVFVMVAHRPAHADCRGAPCPQWLNVIGYTFLAGVTVGYTAGTGYFVYSDLNDADQTRAYGVTELTANGLLASIFTVGTIDAVRSRSAGGIVAFGGLTALHTTLAVHGIWRTYRESGDLELPDGNGVPQTPLLWVGGSLYGLNTLYWISQMPDRHGRAYGITEAAVNAPIAAGLGYLAYDRFATYRGGPGLVYGAGAAISTWLVVDGIRTAIAQRPSNNFDLVPMFDGDSTGVSLAGTW